MKPAFIVDCSVAMAWCFEDESTSESSALLNRLEVECVLVPSLWYIEVTNVLAVAERCKRIMESNAVAFLDLIRMLDIETDQEWSRRAFDHLLPLCRKHRLTSYDAVYLDLAMRSGLPLATLDTELRAAARSLGIEVIGRRKP